MSVARKILENTFIQVFGKLVTAILSILVLKIITEYLGAAGYGDYTAIYQYLALFGIVADFGIYTITVREMSKDETKIPFILGNVMSLRTFLSIFAMLIALSVAFFIPNYSSSFMMISLSIASLATIINLLNGAISSVLQVYLKMKYATIGLVVGKVVSVLYMVWVAYYAFSDNSLIGFYHLLIAGIIGNLVMFLITYYYVNKFCKITYLFDFKYWLYLFLNSLPFGAALILNTIYFKVDVLLMSFLLPHSDIINNESVCNVKMCSDTEIGLYGVAMRMLELLIIIPTYFMNSVLPVMTRYIEEKNDKIQQLMQYSFDFLLATSLPILIGGLILAKPIIYFISNSEFISGNKFEYGSDIAIQILLFAMFFSFLNALFGFILVVLNKQIKLMFINAIAVIFNLVSNIYFIPIFGFRGAAMTSVISSFIILFFLYLSTRKLLDFKISILSCFKILFSSLLMGVVVYFGYILMSGVHFAIQLFVLLPVGIIVYVFFMLKTKAITTDMISLIRKK